jgi:hypothetical protein
LVTLVNMEYHMFVDTVRRNIPKDAVALDTKTSVRWAFVNWRPSWTPCPPE